MRRLLNRVWMFTRLAVALICVGLLITREYPPPGAFSPAVYRMLAGDVFDFVGWEVGALAAKAEPAIVPAQDYVEASRRKSLVSDYIELVKRIERVQDEIDGIYSDPKIADPLSASARQRQELADLRVKQNNQQTLVETILEEQVSTVLSEKGFAVGGQVVPPLKFRLTPLPQMLIVSPRDEIYQKDAFSLQAGLTTDRAEEIEREVDRRFNVSSLVESIGGMGLYPTMLLETTSLDWTLEVAAHEWTHNWLTLRPLGLNYEKSPQTRTMNETAASIVGKEIGELTLQRFYPELAPPPRPPRPPGPAPTPTRDPNRFDFRAEMRDTRIEVDRLLAEARKAKAAGDVAMANARINEAEDYMHQRRTVFAERGYTIRKLNQAYFAFHGAYADEPGAAGQDPVGPAVKRLRDASPSLLAFLQKIAPMTSFDELKRALGE